MMALIAVDCCVAHTLPNPLLRHCFRSLLHVLYNCFTKQ